MQALHDDEVDGEPGQDQGAQQFPLNAPRVLDARSDAEDTTT